MNEKYVVDIEGDGLHPTKIHVVSVQKVGEKEVHSTGDYSKIREFFRGLDPNDYVIGHNFSRWDVLCLKRILGVEIPCVVFDTLAFSWYLYPTRLKHGLDIWGDELGIKKPKIDDWDTETYEVYRHRCEHDVRITSRLFDKQWGLLTKMYPASKSRDAFVRYLAFKMKCARLAEERKWKIDLPKTRKNIEELRKIRDEKFAELRDSMPRVPKYKVKTPPARPRKKDGTLSATGQSWVALAKSKGVPPWGTKEIKVIDSWEEPNPGSPEQVKAWLFSLGWKPCTFKENKKGKEVPQISDLVDKTKLTPSVEKLIDNHPEVEYLEGLSQVKHRLGILEGFLRDCDSEGYVKAEIQGFTNTLRFKHTGIVNLPGADSPYGEYVRGVLIAPEGHELCGSDMASLEDRTKQHYIYPYDPKYVESMMTPDFDPHLDLALIGKGMTEEEVALYKSGDKDAIKRLKPIRHQFKTTNYTCTYGAGAPKVAKAAGVSLERGTALRDAYWERNWAIKEVADAQEVREIEGQTWLRNPLNKFWYSLRHEKDRFSTLNQGTGSYCFDVWLGFILAQREEITAQFHDECVFTIRKGHREEMSKILRQAIDETNELLKLNRELDISIDFGDNYAQIH